MTHIRPATPSAADEFDQLASDLSIAVWNGLAQLPQFTNLHPKDFPLVFETVSAELKRMGVKAPGKGGH
jgi:hypothetical protein